MTVFSAPDYPQFQLPGERYKNLGAVLRLTGPDFSTPHALQFAASLPRPEVRPPPPTPPFVVVRTCAHFGAVGDPLLAVSPRLLIRVAL